MGEKQILISAFRCNSLTLTLCFTDYLVSEKFVFPQLNDPLEKESPMQGSLNLQG